MAHIFLALSSIACSTYLLLRPSDKSLRISQILFAGTLTSGTALVLSNPLHLVQACTSGILYCIGTIAVILITNRKLSSNSH